MSDWTTARLRCPDCFGHLPPPDTAEAHSQWWQFMSAHPREWKDAVCSISFHESVLDRRRVGNVLPGAFACSQCADAVFASKKARTCHERIAHGVKCNARLYAGSDGLCKACGTVFSCRTRLIAHLTDSRRPACIRFARERLVPLADDVVQRLDARDREARKAARRSGYSQPLSAAPARTAAGRNIGRPGTGTARCRGF